MKRKMAYIIEYCLTKSALVTSKYPCAPAEDEMIDVINHNHRLYLHPLACTTLEAMSG